MTLSIGEACNTRIETMYSKTLDTSKCAKQVNSYTRFISFIELCCLLHR